MEQQPAGSAVKSDAPADGVVKPGDTAPRFTVYDGALHTGIRRTACGMYDRLECSNNMQQKKETT